MKITDVEIGGRYIAKVSGQMTTVKVLAIREVPPAWHTPGSTRWQKRIDVVNERTGRQLTFRSAARLRRRTPGMGAGTGAGPMARAATPQPEGGA